MAKVLIIDDEKAILSAMKEIIEYEGIEVHCAEDGPTGLKLTDKEVFDLIKPIYAKNYFYNIF